MDNYNTELDYLLSVLDNSLFKAQELLATLSFDANFSQKVKLAFGEKVDTAKAESLLQEFSQQDSLYLPKIEIRDKSEINGAKAAFAGENHTIYIAQEFLQENANNTDNIAAVLLEELGHAIDFQVNPVDTAGDEGELFSALIRGVNLSEGELQRIKTEDDSAIVTIGGQTLQIEQNYVNLEVREGYGYRNDSLSYSSYSDTFSFSITTTGGASDYISVSSGYNYVDLVLELWNANGNRIDIENDNDFSYNYEEIPLEDLPAGTYTIVVYDDYDGYYTGGYSFPYKLEIDAPQILADQYEPNNTASAATNLGTFEGLKTITNQTIHRSTDVDWFAFTTTTTSTNQNYLEINFDGQAGNLAIALWDSFGQRLYSQDGSANNVEGINLAGLPAGTYYIEAGSYVGATSPNYTLKINAPTAPSIPQDTYESNNTLQTAKVLNTTDGSELLKNLTIHSSTDTDFFKFTTAGLSTEENYIAAYFDWTQGVIDMNLFDSSGNWLYYALGSYGWNYISLAGLPAGTYYVQAGSYQGNTSPNYTLEFNTPVALSGDRFEPNNTTFTNLQTVTGFKRENNLSIHTTTDIDWFTFKITGQTTNQHFIGIDFDNFEGNLDLALYDSQGRVLDYQVNNTDGEVISLEGLPEGTYNAAVYSWLGQTNNYDLIINAPGTTSSVTSDQFESNNTRSAAKSLKDAGWQQERGFKFWDNLSISAGDEDWFKFNLGAGSTAGNYLAIAFDNNLGDLDLELYNSSGTRVNYSTGFRDVELISLDKDSNGTVIPEGTYYARVVGYQSTTINPNYTLLINTPGGDGFEDNDTKAQAKDLTSFRTTYQKSWDNLSIDDDDWFKFKLPSKGTGNDYIRINFDHSLGDLDLILYNSSGTEIDSSEGVSNSEQISLQGQNSGDYFIKVIGYDGDTNPNYSLTINAPVSNNSDGFESNNTQSNAYDLNKQLQQAQQGQQRITIGNDPEKPLSIHSSSDVDWFKFTIASKGQAGDFASIAFDHTLGDLDLYLYDSPTATVPKLTSEGIANVHQIDLKDLAVGTYYLQVKGYNGSTNPTYTLTVDAAFNASTNSSSNDFEPNNSINSAANLDKISGLKQYSNLAITANDEDWFKFETYDTGKQGNAVSIEFDSDLGDLDIELRTPDGKTLTSEGVGNTETISLSRLPKGIYYLKVHGYDGDTNPNYKLSIDAPLNSTGDWAEANNSNTTAFNLRDVQGLQTWDTLSLHNGTDVDWFKFTTRGTADANDFVRIQFDHTVGDLDLYLYDSTGNTLLGKSETADGFESIALKNAQGTYLNAGTYLVKVARHSQNSDAVNYQLLVNAPSNNQSDWAELNDSRNQAEDFQEVQGTQIYSDLSIHQGGDQDWLKFETVGKGVEGHSVSIDFDHSQGDLQLQLYDSKGKLIEDSLSNSNRERISLAGLNKGTYYIKVIGKDNTVTNPNYSLIIDAPQIAETDWIDKQNANNSRTSAYNLRTIEGSLVLNGLSIHPNTDQDWFKFTLAEDAVAGQVARIDFNHFEGNLKLELLNSI